MNANNTWIFYNRVRTIKKMENDYNLAETKVQNGYEGKINWRIILHPRPHPHLLPKCRPEHAFLRRIHKPRL